jgi:hypothetical protein
VLRRVDVDHAVHYADGNAARDSLADAHANAGRDPDDNAKGHPGADEVTVCRPESRARR